MTTNDATAVELDVHGRHIVLELQTNQLDSRGTGDLITAEIVDADPLSMKSCS